MTGFVATVNARERELVQDSRPTADGSNYSLPRNLSAKVSNDFFPTHRWVEHHVDHLSVLLVQDPSKAIVLLLLLRCL